MNLRLKNKKRQFIFQKNQQTLENKIENVQKICNTV